MRRRESELKRESSERRESIGRPNPRQVSLSDPAPVQMVTVAALPPRLPPGPGGPRTGVPMADVFNWDEAINWAPSPADLEKQKTRSNGFFRRTLTTQRYKANPDLPPFVMKQVPYEVWRKHYAKDKEGNYKGTHAPAEDCLLKPHDVERWKFKGYGGEGTSAEAWGSRFTRGKEALPVYGEVMEEGMVPGYEADYDPSVDITDSKEQEDVWKDDDLPPPEEPILEELQGHASRQDTPQPPPSTPLEQGLARDPNSGLPYDPQREREELIARNARPEGWKAKLKRGLEMASMATDGGQIF